MEKETSLVSYKRRWNQKGTGGIQRVNGAAVGVEGLEEN